MVSSTQYQDVKCGFIATHEYGDLISKSCQTVLDDGMNTLDCHHSCVFGWSVNGYLSLAFIA